MTAADVGHRRSPVAPCRGLPPLPLVGDSARAARADAAAPRGLRETRQDEKKALNLEPANSIPTKARNSQKGVKGGD